MAAARPRSLSTVARPISFGSRPGEVTTTGGVPAMVGLGNRALQIPSVVFLRDDGSMLVGEQAERAASTDPTRVVDWRACDGLHTALVQILLRMRPVLQGPCRDGFLQQWIAPQLHATGDVPPAGRV